MIDDLLEAAEEFLLPLVPTGWDPGVFGLTVVIGIIIIGTIILFGPQMVNALEDKRNRFQRRKNRKSS